MQKENVYEYTHLPFEKRLGEGFDYKEVILKKTTSARLFNNDVMAGFMGYINSMLYETIESVKKIRVHFNYVVNKNDKRIQ